MFGLLNRSPCLPGSVLWADTGKAQQPASRVLRFCHRFKFRLTVPMHGVGTTHGFWPLCREWRPKGIPTTVFVFSVLPGSGQWAQPATGRLGAISVVTGS